MDIITDCWKLGGKTTSEHCGRFTYKSEDRRIAKLQKGVKPTGLTSLKGFKQEGESKSVISRQNLIEEQSNDNELLDLFEIVVQEVVQEVPHLPAR